MLRYTTYEMLKNIISADLKAGIVDTAYIDDMMYKLDVFLIGNRISAEEYNELKELLYSGQPKK